MVLCSNTPLLQGVGNLPRMLSQNRPYAKAFMASSRTIRRLNTASNRLPPLSLMPTSILLRSYFLTSILASPRILNLCLPLMNKMANSQSYLWNPDNNIVLHTLVRRLGFDHFTAGETEAEVRKTITEMKNLGFKGVILGYAKEVNVTGGETKFVQTSIGDVDAASVKAWKDGTLKTLSFLGKGDFLAIKYSGAGKATLDAMARGDEPPKNMWEATEEICDAVIKQGSRVWIDAEQQDLQPTIDEWTIRLMRKYNKGEKAVVYTTMQAYLKHTADNIGRHLQIAQDQGWILGVKLVRGAYIATEQRNLIHDTIEDTHNAYNTIAENMLRQTYPGVPSDKPYPRSELFLATHNEDSIKQIWAVQQSLVEAGQPTVELAFGQLQGMADEVSCSLLQLCQTAPANETDAKSATTTPVMTPQAFKCLTWGSTQECLQFLLRRVRENTDALGRTKYWVGSFRTELWRRMSSPGQTESKEMVGSSTTTTTTL